MSVKRLLVQLGEKGKHTDGNKVGEIAKLAQAERGIAHMATAREHVDGNGSGVRRSQANDTDTGKGVKGNGGAKVDETEHNLDNHAEHHGVQGHVELLVDCDPPLGAGDGTVASKGPDAAGGGGGAADAADEGEDHEGNQETDGAARGADGGLDDVGDGLARGDDGLDFASGHDEHEGDEEEQAGKGVDEDGGDHGLGDLGGGFLDFFAHTIVKLAQSDPVGWITARRKEGHFNARGATI